MTTEIQAAITAAVAALIIAGSQGCAPGTKIWVVAEDSRPPQAFSQGRPKPLGAVGRGSDATALETISDKDRRTLARLLKALK